MNTNRPIKDFGNVAVRVDGINSITFLAESEIDDGAYIPPQHIWINQARLLRDWLNEQFPQEEDAK